MTESILFNGLIALGLLAAVQMVLLLVVLRRSGSSNEPDMATQQTMAHLQSQLTRLSEQTIQQNTLADELSKHVRGLSQDLTQAFAQNRQDSQSALIGIQQNLTQSLGQGQQAQAEQLRNFSDVLHKTSSLLNDQFNQIRQSLEQKIQSLQADNAKKLDEMRQTVDEKLHATLEQRLGQSFKLVSDRLEQVYKGLGEMQTLATGVGDLKRVLTNVKTRGTWGEVQLQALLEQMLTPSQFGQNIKPVPGSSNIVEFAVRLPGKDDDKPVWLPIDSKFPKDQYERLLDAFDRADPDGVAQASKALEQAVRLEAKSIAEKYLSPPHTTDFGILFLPTEGLYAEVVKRPGLVDDLQRQYRVTVAGPITLTTLLNALQLGFKTLALEQRSSEVWTLLSAVKTEFSKFGDVLAKTKETLERAAKNIESAEVRTRAMHRKLKGIDQLPEPNAQALLGLNDNLMDDEADGVDAPAGGQP